MMQVPFVFSSNGNGFLFHDKTITDGPRECELTVDEFPSPTELWHRYCNKCLADNRHDGFRVFFDESQGLTSQGDFHL